MAKVTVADISTTWFNSNSGSVSHVVSFGEVLIVGVVLENTDTSEEVLSVIWNGSENLTHFTAFSPTHSKLRIEVWHLTNPTATTANVTVTIKGGNSQKTGVVAVSLQNVDTTTPLEGAVTQESSSAQTGSVTVVQEANDLAFCFAGHFSSSGGTFSPSSGETEHADFIAVSAFKMWAASEDGSGSTTLSWSISGGGNKEVSTLGFNINANVLPSEQEPNAKFYKTLESVNPPTKYLTNGMWIYMVPQFKPESVLILGYAAGTVAALIRLLYGDDVKITGVDLEPCEATYGVEFVQADAKDYIKTCEKFDVIIVDLFDLGGSKIPDFVYEEWFVLELAKKGNYIIVDCFYEPKSNMKYYKKHLRRYGKNKPNRLVNTIWYFGTKDYEHLIIR